MPSPLRDPKSLPDWIEHDYYHRLRWLRGIWSPVVWITFFVVAILGGVLYWFGPTTYYQANRVSSAHAMFNEDCARCHTDHLQTVRRLWSATSEVHSVPDSACIACHLGPTHQEYQVKEPKCSTCHEEHRGQMKLARVADGFCTDCHAQLTRKDGEKSGFWESIRDFQGHPEFAVIRKELRDQGHIKFNHAAHLKEGGIVGPDRKPIELQCVECHQPDAERRYMKPINFEDHCRKCHPLSAQLVGDWNKAELNQAADTYSRQQAPHKEPTVVRAFVRERVTELARKYPGLLQAENAAPAERPFGGRPRLFTETSQDAATWVDKQVENAEKVLFEGAGGCSRCHDLKDGNAKPRSRETPHYALTNIPKRWLEHSVFSHDSHRLLNCVECHDKAPTSRLTQDVLLPHVDVCQKCHQPRVQVRSDCVTCHIYHHRDSELHWSGKMTIDAALRREADKK